MKTIYDMTDGELLALDDDAISRHIDIECAKQGIPLLPEYPAAPIKPTPTPDVAVHQIGNGYADALLFTDAAEAAEVARAINSARSRVTLQYAGGSFDYRIVAPTDESVTMRETMHYSPEHWNREREAVVAAAEAKKRYDSELEAYRKAQKERQAIAGEIHERISEAYERAQRRHFLETQYGRYLQLAENDGRVARKFLVDAYADAREVLSYLFVEEAPALAEA